MFCTACGTRNAEVSNFCKQCGHKLDRVGGPRISEEAFDRALPMEEQVSALLERAYRLRKSGELSAAVRLCEEALHLNPESTSVHSLLGQIHEQTGNHDAAIHEYERVLQLNPGSIADRVKLDELRGDGLPTPLHPRTAPHIVMPNRSQPIPTGRQMLGIAGIAGALMAMGGLIALQFFAHRDKNDNQAGVGNPRNTTRSVANNAPTDPSASTGTGAGSPTLAYGANPNSAPASNTGFPASGLPTNGTYTPYVNYAPTPVYVDRRPIIIHEQTPSAATPARNGSLPNLRPQSAGDGGDDRVRLPDGSGGQYSITVRPNGDSSDMSASENGGSGASKNANSPTSKTGNNVASSKGSTPRGGPPAIAPQIKVHTPPDNSNAGSNLAAPTTEAQSLIAIASDKFKTSDFDGAIKVYRRALPGAGSQTAYVHMQMGICFQHIKNKASAIDHFQQAIAEYQKLESANQQVDLDRVGIKVCENGIKLCNAE